MFTVRPLRLALTATLTVTSLVVISQPWQTPAPLQKIAPATTDTIVNTSDPLLPAVADSKATAARGTLHRAATAADVGDIPTAALSAYGRAATVAGRVDTTCGLSWTLLAAIGGVESDHGRYGGSRLDADGVSHPVIRGVVLDGRGRVAKVADTDAGQVDGDKRWDRAVGPMQFLPSTWATVGVDADGDGVRSADDIDDAALGAAVFLCGAPGSLDTRHGLREALHRYNPSTAYADQVIALEQEYADQYAQSDTPLTVRAAGSLPTVATTKQHGDRANGQSGQHHASDDQAGQSSGHQSGHASGHQSGHQSGDQSDHLPNGQHGHSGDPSTDPTDPPTTDPTDPPSTDPSDPPTVDPATVELTGTLQACGTGQAWCLDATELDLGDDAYLATTALADFDGDGTVETNADELTGLEGTEVTVVVPGSDDGTAPRVLEIDGAAYVADDDVSSGR